MPHTIMNYLEPQQQKLIAYCLLRAQGLSTMERIDTMAMAEQLMAGKLWLGMTAEPPTKD